MIISYGGVTMKIKKATAAAADTSDDSSTAQTGLTEGLVFAGIVLAGSAVVIANAKRKK